jgi:two-component system, chemotaxis family, CheB/CheR fusion protein
LRYGQKRGTLTLAFHAQQPVKRPRQRRTAFLYTIKLKAPVIPKDIHTNGHKKGMKSGPRQPTRSSKPRPVAQGLAEPILSTPLKSSSHLKSRRPSVLTPPLRVQLDSEVELATARLAAIVEGSDDAIIAKDLNGVIKSWNLGAERIFGYSAEQVIGKPITILIPPDRMGEEAVILESIRRGEHVDHYESIRRHKDGRLLNVSLTISPIVDSRGHIVGASKIARNITERKLADAALVKAEKLAAAGRLAATMAHEINNPLQSVTNLIALLANSPRLHPEEKALARAAEEELGRIAHLTRQSLSFYRDNTAPVPVSLEETVEGVVTIFANRMKVKDISLMKRYSSNVPQIKSFAGEIRQVITALLLNAIDAVPRGGTISVRIHKLSRWADSSIAGVRLLIADNGIGISPENRGRIFEPFFTTKGEQGTGLGLWVANGIVSRLGGSIQARSSTRPGRTGSCFSISLPLQMPTESATPELVLATF